MPWSNSRRPTAASAARRAEYDTPAYRRARAAIQAQVAAGTAYCWRCGRYLPPGAPVHTGHDDYDRSIIRGPECPACNLSAAARKGNRASRTTARRL